ncbi:MAG: hypothetical protein KDM63_14540, partial [Verrucomicrobiae bacterium]|nr:hypothetical protein [Verrucomicrobiae bacterium]
ELFFFFIRHRYCHPNVFLPLSATDMAVQAFFCPYPPRILPSERFFALIRHGDGRPSVLFAILRARPSRFSRHASPPKKKSKKNLKKLDPACRIRARSPRISNQTLEEPR